MKRGRETDLKTEQLNNWLCESSTAGLMFRKEEIKSQKGRLKGERRSSNRWKRERNGVRDKMPERFGEIDSETQSEREI